MSRARRWFDAAKPASWPKLLVPFALGQSIGLAHGLDVRAVLLGLAFTVLDLLFIVFLNDWGDREVDAIKRRMFPTSSPKTIPDGHLPAAHLLVAGALAGLGAIGVAGAAQAWLDRPWLVPLALVALGIFAAYTLPPLRLNYRGGGELLEMLGVGVALPWLHAYLHSGDLMAPGLALLPGFALLSLASAVASGLSDERSDRAGGKRTVASVLGNRVARRAVEALTLLGVGAWIAAALKSALPFWIAGAAAMVALFHAGHVITLSERAITDRFDAQRAYKGALHRAIWRGALTASMFLAAWHLFLASSGP